MGSPADRGRDRPEGMARRVRGRDARWDGAGPYACPTPLFLLWSGTHPAERHADRRRRSAVACREPRRHVQASAKIRSWIWLGSVCWPWPRASDGIGPARSPGVRNWHWPAKPWAPGTTVRRGSGSPDWRSTGPTTAKSSCSWASARRRGPREEALAAWAKVAPTDRSFARAARFRASNLIHMGKYSPAEEILLRALADPGPDGPRAGAGADSALPFEGRFGDMRRVLRASWCRSPDPRAC